MRMTKQDKTFSVRRTGSHLGLFRLQEIHALCAKGKLGDADEVQDESGSWVSLGLFVRANPLPSSISPAPSAKAGSHSLGPSCHVHDNGKRIGPLEISKLEGMVKIGLLNSSSRVELPGSTPPYPSLAEYLTIPVPPPLPPVEACRAAVPPNTTVVGSSKSSSGGAPPRNGVSYLDIWWKATLVIYILGVLLGYLSQGPQGMAFSMGAGIVVAPIKGAFWAWIIWLFRR